MCACVCWSLFQASPDYLFKLFVLQFALTIVHTEVGFLLLCIVGEVINVGGLSRIKAICVCRKISR